MCVHVVPVPSPPALSIVVCSPSAIVLQSVTACVASAAARSFDCNFAHAMSLTVFWGVHALSSWSRPKFHNVCTLFVAVLWALQVILLGFLFTLNGCCGRNRRRDGQRGAPCQFSSRCTSGIDLGSFAHNLDSTAMCKS